MSFSGDLEHLPLIDVIQLLQQTGKSGTLRLNGARGECQLGFQDGRIVGANHPSIRQRLGAVLVELGAISRETLEATLAERAARGPHPPPLIALLLETGRANRLDACRGLQAVIEQTIVEALTWPKGRFELDVEQVLVSEEYRYFSDRGESLPLMNTQNTLMEALRIFDEKKRDGTLKTEGFDGARDAAEADEVISADDLGLGDVESLRRRIPHALAAPAERCEDGIHRRKIEKELPGLPVEDQERLVAFLVRIGELPPPGDGADAGLSLAVILFTRDQIFSHAVMTCCAVRNIFVFATDEPQNLVHIIEQSLARDLTPLLVIDPPDEDSDAFSEASANATMQEIRDNYPALRFVSLVGPGRDDLALRALTAGALVVLPKPAWSTSPSSFAADFINFVEAFQACLRQAGSPLGRVELRDFAARLAELGGLTKPTDILLALLQFASSLFPRVLTLLVAGAEVIVERAIGLSGGHEVTPALKTHLPVERSSVCAAVIDSGLLFQGPVSEDPMLGRLYEQIGEPHSPKIAVLPLKTGAGRVVALIYGDFGAAWATPVPIELLAIFARHAGLVLDTLTQRTRA